MQPINLDGVTSVILSTPYSEPIEVSVEVIKTIFNLGIDVRDKILALKNDVPDKINYAVEYPLLEAKAQRLYFENENLKDKNKQLIDALDGVGRLLDYCINATPTGMVRNLLTDANVTAKAALEANQL